MMVIVESCFLNNLDILTLSKP